MAIGSPVYPTRTNPHQQTRGDIINNQVRRVLRWYFQVNNINFILGQWQHMYEQFGLLQAYMVSSCTRKMPTIDWIGGKLVVSISFTRSLCKLYKALSTMIKYVHVKPQHCLGLLFVTRFAFAKFCSWRYSRLLTFEFKCSCNLSKWHANSMWISHKNLWTKRECDACECQVRTGLYRT